MKFEKIIIPPGWQDSFTKYPNGRTILEALSQTITSVNEGIEEVNQKVNQGLLAIDQAENTIRQEITESFNTLQLQLEGEIDGLSNDLIADFALLQSEVLTLIAGKANAADVYTKQQVDAQLAEKVQNFKIKNEIVNGDFGQGTTGWIGLGATIAEEGGRLAITASTQYGGARQNISVVIGRKYYIGALLESLASQTYIVVIGEGASTTTKPNSGVSILSNIFTATSTGSKQFAINNGLASGWVKFHADNVKVIDLTTTFGAGNEPTKLEMDELMRVIPNQWWDGELTLEQKEIVQWMLKLEREKANKTQEAWITPTLLNNWIPFDADLSAGYMKDTLGFVHLKGVLKGGITGRDAFILPIGYRPDKNRYFIGCGDNSFGLINIMSSGNVQPTAPAGVTGFRSLDGITFKAGV